MESNVDFVLCKDLGVQLHLNLATCAIKLGFFQRTLDLCSIVISFKPDSTKARFRRAKAAKVALEMGMIAMALDDLTTTASLDPGKKEIQSELGKVVVTPPVY